MNFEDALRSMRDGEFVARKGWVHHLYMRKSSIDVPPIRVFKKNIGNMADVGNEWNPNPGDITANDWIVCIETFGFEEALRRLKQDKYVRRTEWTHGFYVVKRDREFFQKAVGGSERAYSATSIDLFAEDWVEHKIPGPF